MMALNVCQGTAISSVLRLSNSDRLVDENMRMRSHPHQVLILDVLFSKTSLNRTGPFAREGGDDWIFNIHRILEL